MGNFHRLFILLVCIFVNQIVAPPPNRQAAEQQQQATPEQEAPPQKPLYQFAYSKYLESVVGILENDPKFTERLRGMKEEDIKAGKIADHIDELSSDVFDQLTKAKLTEIERLREEIGKQIEKDGGAHNIAVPDHIDVNNWEKFNKEDLRKLVVKTVADMEEIDRQRREDFKQYEMQKKAEEDHKLAGLTPEERAKAESELEASKKRHNEHEKLNHPGGREQLEEVWEESDHMDKDNFDPRTFFALHDLNGDGYWNDNEIEALFQQEIQKMYNDSNPDDDPKERIEEMYRMREHVVAQMDKNKDRLISLEEFLQDNEVQGKEATKEEEWKDIAHQEIYTEEELRKFEQEYAKQQGWGDHAYDPNTGAPPVPNDLGHQQPPQANQGLPPGGEAAHPQAPAANHEPSPQQVPVQVHAAQEPEKKPAPIDPGYGI